MPSDSPTAVLGLVLESFERRRELPVPARAAVVRALTRLDPANREVVRQELSAMLEQTPPATLGVPSDAPDARARRADDLSLARLAVFGAQQESLEPAEAVGWAARVVEGAPDDAEALVVLADALTLADEDERALTALERAAKSEEYFDPYGLHMRLGVLLYNARNYESAAKAYGTAVNARPTGRAHLYLADALRAQEDFDGARRHYLAALNRDRLLVDALRGYWGITEVAEGPGNFDRIAKRLMEARPAPVPLNRWLRPLTWRLLKSRYRRHPEDARLHLMLGATALLRGDLAFAAERLLFAYFLPPGRDFSALIGGVLATGLQGDIERAQKILIEALEFAQEHPVDAYGRPIVSEENYSDIVSPFFWEPRLGTYETSPIVVGLLTATLTPFEPPFGEGGR